MGNESALQIQCIIQNASLSRNSFAAVNGGIHFVQINTIKFYEKKPSIVAYFSFGSLLWLFA